MGTQFDGAKSSVNGDYRLENETLTSSYIYDAYRHPPVMPFVGKGIRRKRVLSTNSPDFGPLRDGGFFGDLSTRYGGASQATNK